MTKEEAIKYLKGMKDECNDTFHKVRYVTQEEALDMAIKALEQEPTDDATLKDIFCMGCEYKEQEPSGDAIDREYLFNVLDDFCGHDRTATITLDTLADLVYDMSPVNPQEPKTGHWIERRNRATGHIESVCSECGAEEGYPYNIYCGNCGCRMFEPQERSKE